MGTAANLGDRIREQRKTKGLSQSELAAKLDLSHVMVSVWERGKSIPTEVQIQKLNKILGGLKENSQDTFLEMNSNKRAKNGKKGDNLGQRIIERRRANALSQSELADRLQVSQMTISRWEEGKNSPTDEKLVKLHEILGSLIPNSDEDTEAETQTAVSAWLSRAIAKKNLTASELAAKANVSVPTVYNILNGRAQNPNSRTITALEKALDDAFESKEETREASKIIGIGQLIDFNPYDVNEIPTKPGVYVLYDISQRPIYVGKANKISARINDHSSRFWFKRPLVETGAFVEIKDKTLRDQIETVLIQFLKNNAVINKQKTVRDEE